MVVELGCFGCKNGKGFYEYFSDGKKFIWLGFGDFIVESVD